MKYEKYCGAVIYTYVGSEIRYVLVQSRAGHFGFPKGHMEIGETEEETALREVLEEVRLCPVFHKNFREVSEYVLPSGNVQKQVVFFLGYYALQEIIPQESELQKASLVSFEEALVLLELEDNRRILKNADLFLQNYGKDKDYV